MVETKTPRLFSGMCSDFSGMNYIWGHLFDMTYLFLTRWRVALMERSIAKLDFMEFDDMIQVHGEQDSSSSYTAWSFNLFIP